MKLNFRNQLFLNFAYYFVSIITWLNRIHKELFVMIFIIYNPFVGLKIMNLIYGWAQIMIIHTKHLYKPYETIWLQHWWLV